MEMVDKKYKLYLQDLGPIILERALEAKKNRSAFAKGSDSYMFESGRLMAFNEVISIIQQQAKGFDIKHRELGMDGIDPDRDLL